MTPSEKATTPVEQTIAEDSVVPTLSPARVHTIVAGLWLCLFVSAMDTTIVTTALIKISSGFNALEQGAWLVTAYLLTYNSFLLISAKLSDVWGLRSLLISCAAVFLIFSMACGAAQSMTQLIVFRALQGIGGSGLYSLTFVSIMKLVAPEKIALYSGVISSVFAMANLLGPLLGGIISDRSSWRYIFFLNGPVMVVAIGVLFMSIPPFSDGKTNMERVRGLDWYGGILSVCWPVPLIFALQEAGVSHAWSSGAIISTLTTGIALFLAFGLYETWVTYKTPKDPIFPIRFLRNPAMALILLSQFLLGMPFYVVFVQLPQRFQAVNFTSAERAGIFLLPATMFTPVGAMLAGAVAKKIPTELLLVTAAAFVTLGVGLLGSLPTHSHLWPGTYGYEIITGFGLGLCNPPYFMLIATSLPNKDVAVGTGALNMVRTLGGCVAVAICSAIHREFSSDRLSAFLSPEQIAAVQKSSGFIAQLPEDVRDRVGEVFGQSYNRQFQIMLAFAGLNIIVAIAVAMVRKKMGIFNTMPVRKEQNEFTRAGKPVAEEVEKSEGTVVNTDAGAIQPAASKEATEGPSVSQSKEVPEKAD